MAGADNYRHKFYLQVKAQSNVFGEDSVSWQRETEFWGSISALKGAEYFGNAQFKASMTHRIKTRYLQGVVFTPAKRVVKATSTDRVFNIQSVENVDERNYTIEMMVQEDAAST